MVRCNVRQINEIRLTQRYYIVSGDSSHQKRPQTNECLLFKLAAAFLRAMQFSKRFLSLRTVADRVRGRFVTTELHQIALSDGNDRRTIFFF